MSNCIKFSNLDGIQEQQTNAKHCRGPGSKRQCSSWIGVEMPMKHQYMSPNSRLIQTRAWSCITPYPLRGLPYLVYDNVNPKVVNSMMLRCMFLKTSIVGVKGLAVIIIVLTTIKNF